MLTDAEIREALERAERFGGWDNGEQFKPTMPFVSMAFMLATELLATRRLLREVTRMGRLAIHACDVIEDAWACDWDEMEAAVVAAETMLE